MMFNMNKKTKIVSLIPSLNPTEKLINYVNELIDIGFEKIIIVNDGSGEEYNKYFEQLETHKECIVLKHTINKGKGRALKTGFEYYLKNFKDYDGIVTSDSDGQHSAKDTKLIACKLSQYNNSLILGSRNFDLKNVPFKSKSGNKITSFIFKLLYGKKINDTQTGLRGIPNNYIQSCLDLVGERFEYEINMLCDAVEQNIDIKEIIIETIYLNENQSSHFNPIKDSIRIYKVIFSQFLKFTISGIISFVSDILLFNLIINFIFNNSNIVTIMTSTILARIFSSYINYNLNRKNVFNSKAKNTLFKYYLLCAIQVILSGIITYLLFKLNIMNETVCKTITDLTLFFVSYNIQKKYVF